MPDPGARRDRGARAISRRPKIAAGVWLVLIYLVAAAAHVIALKPQSVFPLLATDEVQYVSVGENIRLGNGFTAHGEFHAGLPPLYPLFVAFAHSWGSNARVSALWLSCLTICLAVFPAYGLAQHIGVSRWTSFVLAAAAAFLPNTLWAGLYMAETLNYPLFLATFYVLANWVEEPTVAGDWMAGLLLSAMVLTKVAAWSLVVAVAMTAAVLVVRSKDEQLAWHAFRVFAIVAATQIVWQVFKSSHHAAGMGMYGRALGDFGLSRLTPSLLLVYFSDFLLAPGLLISVPLLFWFREDGRRRRALSILLAATLICEIVIHSVLEGGLTGFLKERLLLYSFPIMAIFAVKGIEVLGADSRWKTAFVMAVPLAFLSGINLYAFAYNPVLDIPWASALGSVAWTGVDSFSVRQLIIVAGALILSVGCALLFIGHRRMPAVLAGFVLLFNCAAFESSAEEMRQLSERGKTQVDGVAEWLSSNLVNAGDRLILCGRMAYYEEGHSTAPFDPFFVSWQETFGLTDIWNFELETYGRYDVRMVQSPEQFRALVRPRDHVLSATRLSDLDLVSYRFPIYLYAVPKRAVDPRPLYIVDVTSEQASGRALNVPMRLPPGQYRAILHLANAPNVHFSLEGVATKTASILFHSEGTAAEIRMFDFSSPTDSPVQFRLASEREARLFQELTLEFER